MHNNVRIIQIFVYGKSPNALMVRGLRCLGVENLNLKGRYTYSMGTYRPSSGVENLNLKG